LVIDVNWRLSRRSGPVTVAKVARELRKVASRHGSRIDLFLRTPWAAAALFGALLNTVECTLHEWDGSLASPTYVKTITVSAGVGAGPITNIHVTEREGTNGNAA
jgi:hypothetical protein